MKRFLLLDIDGVLVRPLGYRAALRAAFATFASRLGCEGFQVEEEEISRLEAQGISSEFDILPLLLGALLERVISTSQITDLPADFLQALQQPLGASPSLPKDLRVPHFPLTADCFPSEAAYRWGIYPALPQAWREALLLNTRDVYRSATTRLFQQFVLGSESFCAVYGLPATVQTPSYLQEYDQPLLDQPNRERLKRAWRQGKIYPAAMTARPCLPPRGVVAGQEPYPPEAEAALELVGLPDLPLLGLGKLEYIARRAQLAVESLLKPAPAQALAATLAAAGQDDLTAIEAVVKRVTQPMSAEPFAALPPQFELHVVEDTLGGIRSVRTAVKIFEQCGHSVEVHAWGFVDGNLQKRQTLQQAGVPCFDHWGELLDYLGVYG